MTTIKKMNLGTIIEKLGNFDFSDDKLGIADMYMSKDNIWLLDGVDGHHYNSENDGMYETAWSSLDPQYGWIREELEDGETMMDKSERGHSFNSLLKYAIGLGCNPYNMWIVFFSDNTVRLEITDLNLKISA